MPGARRVLSRVRWREREKDSQDSPCQSEEARKRPPAATMWGGSLRRDRRAKERRRYESRRRQSFLHRDRKLPAKHFAHQFAIALVRGLRRDSGAQRFELRCRPSDVRKRRETPGATPAAKKSAHSTKESENSRATLP